MAFIKVVESPGTLHYAPTLSLGDKTARVDFCAKHKLRNEYFMDMLAGKPRVPKSKKTPPSHFQLLVSARWVRHATTGEYVAIIGRTTDFLKSERAKRNDMCFNERTLQDRLSKEQQITDVIKSGDGNHRWRVMPAGYEPSAVALLGDGASLDGIYAQPVAPTEALNRFESAWACGSSSLRSERHQVSRTASEPSSNALEPTKNPASNASRGPEKPFSNDRSALHCSSGLLLGRRALVRLSLRALMESSGEPRRVGSAFARSSVNKLHGARLLPRHCL